jgi:hypothetical protein
MLARPRRRRREVSPRVVGSGGARSAASVLTVLLLLCLGVDQHASAARLHAGRRGLHRDGAAGAAAVAAAGEAPGLIGDGAATRNSLGPWPRNPTCLDGCSGHGSCGIAGHCDCYVGFFGSACEHQTRHFLPPTGLIGVINSAIAEAAAGAAAGNSSLFGDAGVLLAGGGGECPNDCSNRGFCDSTVRTCHCDPGFHGPQCEHDVCPEGCSGHGTCLADGCKCHNGWVGLGCGSLGCPEVGGEERREAGRKQPASLACGTLC